jgi:alkanesulfonate monooxygenase SsuD/methylene tetrahydromethanopterin reductase-like flavin-dependent oxidoreductase (luciferase family)
MRIQPTMIARAAATSAVQLGGRFRLGIDPGEAFNEHILGDAWPGALCGWRCWKKRSR